MLAFRKLDTPYMKVCYSKEWVLYLEKKRKNYAARAVFEAKQPNIRHIWAAQFDKNYAATMP